jgi:hypothetical protein
MDKSFSVGNIVKVSENYHWAKNAIGEIKQPPNYIVEMSDGWKGYVREVKSLKGMLLFYWVEFRESQIDADGDGPYHEAEIDSAYLKLNE